MGTNERNGDGVDVDEATDGTEAGAGHAGTAVAGAGGGDAPAAHPGEGAPVAGHRADGLAGGDLADRRLAGLEPRDRELVPRRSLHVDQRRRRPAGGARSGAARPSRTTRRSTASSSRGTVAASTRSAPRSRSPAHRSRWATRSPRSRTTTVYVDPGTGTVNGTRNDEEGFTWWLYRGHMYLWQDHGDLRRVRPRDRVVPRRTRTAPSRVV